MKAGSLWLNQVHKIQEINSDQRGERGVNYCNINISRFWKRLMCKNSFCNNYKTLQRSLIYVDFAFMEQTPLIYLDYTKLATLAIKAYVGKSKINLAKNVTSSRDWTRTSGAYLTEIIWQV